MSSKALPYVRKRSCGSCSQNLRGVLFDFNLLRLENFGDDAILICDERGAEGAHRRLAIHLFLTIHAELGNELLVHVGDERERQVVFGYELLMALSALNAHAYYRVALVEKALLVVAQVASLIGAARCHVAWIDIEYELLALEIVKSHFFAVLVQSEDLRQSLSYFDHIY